MKMLSYLPEIMLVYIFYFLNVNMYLHVCMYYDCFNCMAKYYFIFMCENCIA